MPRCKFAVLGILILVTRTLRKITAEIDGIWETRQLLLQATLRHCGAAYRHHGGFVSTNTRAARETEALIHQLGAAIDAPEAELSTTAYTLRLLMVFITIYGRFILTSCTPVKLPSHHILTL